LVTAGSDGIARVWDAATGDPVSPPMPHRGGLHDASFSPDGRKVITDCQGPEDIGVKIWAAQTGALLVPLPDGGGHSAFSPDGKYIVTASLDGTARVWDATTGKPHNEVNWRVDWQAEAKIDP
jgi:WD40 repeat protein